MTTHARLLALLSLLQARRDWPGPVLAARLEASPRTVRRDVERLRAMGYGIQATRGPAGGYRLDAGEGLPPLLLDDDQAVAIAIALRTGALPGTELQEAAERARSTIRRILPSRVRHRLDALDVTVVARPGDAPPPAVHPRQLAVLADAIRARETLRLEDDPTDGGPIAPRRIEPHHLVASQGRWYLLAWDLDRDDWRIRRVDRLRLRTPNGPRFVPRTVPGGDVAAFASARFKGSDTDAWACVGTVVLELPARRVVPFAGDGTVSIVDEQRTRLEAGSWSWGSLAAALSRFEAPVEVVGPPELARAFHELAERAAHASRLVERGALGTSDGPGPPTAP